MEYQSPRQSLNKAFLKASPSKDEMIRFKKSTRKLLKEATSDEYEVHYQLALQNYLEQIGFEQYIQTRGHTDLAIFNGALPVSRPGVLIEIKKPVNKSEMVTTKNINKKALHQLILYYMTEQDTLYNPPDIKTLIVTNLQEWFLFDAKEIKHRFFNRTFLKLYRHWKDADAPTSVFYTEVVKPYIAQFEIPLPFTYFNLLDHQKEIKRKDTPDDKVLIPFLKILSPVHLLKQPFANDSNSLDQQFYHELLHLIGLSEQKKGGTHYIKRIPEKDRDPSSLLENTIQQLQTHNTHHHIQHLSRYGETEQEQLFQIALELCITWMNRILFFKLLEAQIISCREGDTKYHFLNSLFISDYDQLNTLFFEVLAKQNSERTVDKEKYQDIPYLNSSLFEPTSLEEKTLFISNLHNDLSLSLFADTILKNEKGVTEQKPLNTLCYLFRFLDAYNFSSEGKEVLQQENKRLINASVLGLIFEKINGYQDGSFFTPGSITMYMSRETIQRAVVHKFNKALKKKKREKGMTDELKNMTDVHNTIEKYFTVDEANQIIESIKICDPSVGSGHFLVSALNELLVIKSDLKILTTESGRLLRGCYLQVENDELIVTNREGKVFEYQATDRESYEIQRTLFHEKKKLIEKSLFGVDLNPNSVKICRLRLWIELLKNAYYEMTFDASLGYYRTLPNIDINIKKGNSLVSQFNMKDNHTALPHKVRDQLKETVSEYKEAIEKYQGEIHKNKKGQIKNAIRKAKKTIANIYNPQDKEYKAWQAKKNEKDELPLIYDEQAKKEWKQRLIMIQKEAEQLEKKYKEKVKRLYQNAFEWRFEFPQILNKEGDFIGFDIVIGNPPYIQLQKEGGRIANQLKEQGYSTYVRTGDIYQLFYERGMQLINQDGLLSFITSNKWMRAGYGEPTRHYLSTGAQPLKLIDMGAGVFDSATVDTNILLLTNQSEKQKKSTSNETTTLRAVTYQPKTDTEIATAFEQRAINITVSREAWTILSPLQQGIKSKIEQVGKPLKEWDIKIYRGVLTGYNDAFIIDGEKKDELINQDPNSAHIIKPILRGRDIQKYRANFADKWLIATFPTLKLDIDKYPAVRAYLKTFGKRIEQTGEKGARKKTAHKWFETQDNIAYYKTFEKEKIVYPNMTKYLPFILDKIEYYTNQKCFILTGKNLTYLVGFLNSNIAKYWIRNNCPELQGGTRELSKIFFENIPIPPLSESEQAPFIERVEEILTIKASNSLEGSQSSDECHQLEQEIDDMVYELYHLSKEEIELIKTNGR